MIIQHRRHIFWDYVRKGLWAFSWLCFLDANWLSKQAPVTWVTWETKAGTHRPSDHGILAGEMCLKTELIDGHVRTFRNCHCWEKKLDVRSVLVTGSTITRGYSDNKKTRYRSKCDDNRENNNNNNNNNKPKLKQKQTKNKKQKQKQKQKQMKKIITYSNGPPLPWNAVQRKTKEKVKGPLGLKEGVQCMLEKFFARKASWLQFTQIVPHQRLPMQCDPWVKKVV